MTLKLGLSLVTNMSLSMSSSLIVGGGSAMASPTRPSSGGGCFRVSENENWGRMWVKICTTWKIHRTNYLAFKKNMCFKKFEPKFENRSFNFIWYSALVSKWLCLKTSLHINAKPTTVHCLRRFEWYQNLIYSYCFITQCPIKLSLASINYF